jgi:hypothetical protein
LDAFRQHLQHADGAALARSVRSVMLEREPLCVPKGWFEILDTSHISVVDEPEKTMRLIDDFIEGL